MEVVAADEQAEDRQTELAARAAGRSQHLLQQLRQLDDPASTSAPAELAATGPSGALKPSQRVACCNTSLTKRASFVI